MNDFSVMLDLETFSTSKNAALASIGALQFNEKEIQSLIGWLEKVAQVIENHELK